MPQEALLPTPVKWPNGEYETTTALGAAPIQAALRDQRSIEDVTSANTTSGTPSRCFADTMAAHSRLRVGFQARKTARATRQSMTPRSCANGKGATGSSAVSITW